MKTFAQILSIFAMLLLIASFQFKKQRSIIIMQLIGCALFSLSYFWLGALMGAITNAINVVKNGIFTFKQKLKADHPAYLVLFSALAIASYVLVFTVFDKEPTAVNFIVELLPVIAVIVSTISFMSKDAKTVRRLNLINSPCWLTYNIVSFSIGGIICEVFCLSSTIIGIIRLDRNKKQPENNINENAKE